MKEDIRQIIEDLHAASRQPLFNGIVGSPDDVATGPLSYHELDGSSFPTVLQRYDQPASKRRCREKNAVSMKTGSWDTILAEASYLLPSMTSHEHGQVSRLVGILLLGFFLPQSTGNNFFSYQNLSTQPCSVSSRQQHQKQQSQSTGIQTAENLNDVQNVTESNVHMSLEERLESISHRYGNEFGELDDVIVQEHLENSFQSFLKIGLRPILLGRPAHATQVDLIHILAMAIHPRPSEQCIRQTTSRLEEQKSDIWAMTTRLMSSLVPNSFNINYHHRVKLVKTVLECLVLPECQHEAGICQNAPLFEGAIPHLRASLYAFGMASISPYDSHLAQRAMVSLATQSGIDHVVKEEWSRLLHRLVDDRTNYDRCSENNTNDQTTILTTTHDPQISRCSDEKFCPHTSRGLLLRDFLIKYNEARHFADEDFLQYSLSSLTDAIEMQVDCWTKGEAETRKGPSSQSTKEDGISPKVDNKEVFSSNHPPLVLASLLNAAKNLFHFLLPIKNTVQREEEGEREDEEIEESDDSHYRDMLISCGIQLVHHWDPAIVKEACTMLVLAFSYTEDMWEDYIGAVFDSVVIAIDLAIKNNEEQGTSVLSIEGLVSAFSQRSLTFALNLFRLLLKEKSSDANPLVAFRLIAAISNARPAVARKHMEALKEHLNEIKDPNVKKHILASILSCRKTHYFSDEEDSLTKLMPIISGSSLGNWDGYLISRHAIMTGNFDIAEEMYNELMNAASSETSFIWLSAMKKVADGEGKLCRNGAKALPDSASKLRMAIGAFRSLQALYQVSVSFQIKLLELRVCFLDLLTNMRQLTVEMRLTGKEPKKCTRPNLHLKNIVKLLYKLSIDYMKFYKTHGLFLCQQSRSVLRTLHALCSFVARAASRVFLDSITVDDEKAHEAFADGDIAQPLTLLLKQLDSFALQKVNQFVDAKIRAVTFLQIMDGILKTPVPTPRSLACAMKLPCASLRLFCDPDKHESAINQLEIYAGTRAVCIASGTIPASLTSRSQIPFNILLLWYTIDSKNSSTKFSALQTSQKGEGGPISASISSSGSFFVKVKSHVLMNEGYYDIKFRLGCRDIRGGEWELPLKDDSNCFFVKVLRSATK